MRKIKELNSKLEALSEVDQFELNQAILTGDLTILDRKPEFKELVIHILEIAKWLPITGKGIDFALSFLIALLKGSDELKHNINK